MHPLTTPDLLRVIFSFQDGAPHMYVPFVCKYKYDTLAGNHYDDEESFVFLLQTSGLIGLKWVYYDRPHYISKEITEYAAQVGLFDVVEYAVNVLKKPLTKRALTSAAQSGNLQLFHHIYQQLTDIDGEDTLIRATQYGHIPIIEYLLERRIEPTSVTVIHAARHGHLEIIRLFYERYRESIDYSKAVFVANAFDHQHVVNYLLNECHVPNAINTYNIPIDLSWAVILFQSVMSIFSWLLGFVLSSC